MAGVGWKHPASFVIQVLMLYVRRCDLARGYTDQTLSQVVYWSFNQR